jgi:cytoskeletal protein CcmA (bactofilin family)
MATRCDSVRCANLRGMRCPSTTLRLRATRAFVRAYRGKSDLPLDVARIVIASFDDCHHNVREVRMKYGENLFARRDPRRDAATAQNGGVPPAGAISLSRPAPAPTHAATPAPVVEAANATTNAKAEEPSGSKLIVGANIKLKGVEINDCDTLVVEGRVEATMVSRTIQIAEGGAFNGKVEVDVAEVRGQFQGEMTARKKLIVHASGRVSGKIRYGRMLVQEGGEMSGDVGAMGGDPGAAIAQFPRGAD